MRSASGRGFTLLEVLLATAIMAVGTTSVLVVIATAAGMASQRQVLLRREQVVDEARHDAQTIVNAFRSGTSEKTVSKGPAKPTATRVAPDKIEARRSTRFDGFSYDIDFVPRDRSVPEKGFDVGIMIHYGGGELSYSATTTLMATAIPEEEFLRSSTYEEERKGLDNTKKTKETK